MVIIEQITEKLFGVNLFTWLKKDYYELDWVYTRKFLNVFVCISFALCALFAPIIMIVLTIGIIYIALKK